MGLCREMRQIITTSAATFSRMNSPTGNFIWRGLYGLHHGHHPA